MNIQPDYGDYDNARPATRKMSASKTLNSKRPTFLDLPTEVRHEIYKHLFCHTSVPISFARLQRTSSSLWQTDDEPQEPTFHTGIFRVNKAISRDALQFAYSSNWFLPSSDVGRFCSLGTTALNSIKTVSVFNSGWQPTEESRKMWQYLNHYCPSLELLDLEPSSHLLVLSIPYLKDFLNTISQGQPRPELQLHLYVWDRHFSFDLPDRDYRQALRALKKKVAPDAWEGFSKPKQVTLNIPKHVKQIRFISDVSPGLVRALDEVLEEDSDLSFMRLSEPVPHTTPSVRVGRQTRICYMWRHIEQTN